MSDRITAKRIMSTTKLQLGKRLRKLRTAQHISIRTLAARTNFSPSFISQIEKGRASPSIASLERIAAVLDTSLGGFFTPDISDDIRISRYSDREELVSSWSRAKIQALGPMGGSTKNEAVMITLLPHGRSGKRPYAHSGEEFGLIFEGEITLTLGSEIHTLRRGDAVTFGSDIPHLWENRTRQTSRVVIVSPRFAH